MPHTQTPFVNQPMRQPGDSTSELLNRSALSPCPQFRKSFKTGLHQIEGLVVWEAVVKTAVSYTQKHSAHTQGPFGVPVNVCHREKLTESLSQTLGQLPFGNG